MPGARCPIRLGRGRSCEDGGIVVARRAIGVAILAVLSILYGLFFAMLGLLVFLATKTFAGAPPWLDVMSLFVAGMGALSVVAGYGLWQLRAWAWWLAVVSSVSGVAGAFLPAFGWWYAILPLVILAYLVLVHDDFRIGKRSPAPVAKERGQETRSRADHRQARRRSEKRKRRT